MNVSLYTVCDIETVSRNSYSTTVLISTVDLPYLNDVHKKQKSFFLLCCCLFYTRCSSQSVADGVRCIKVHPPPPGSMEAAKGPGLRLKGGCLVGIFVGQVNVDGPVGGKSGMRKHDQILSVCEISCGSN